MKRDKRLHIGDQVRKLIQKNTFDKGSARWSKEVFTITGHSQNHWILNDGSNKLYYELQYIKGVASEVSTFDENLKVSKKAKKITRDLNKEGIRTYNNTGLKEIVPEKVRTTRAKTVFDSSLVGRKVKKGNEIGTIVSYEEEGPYHWKVDFPSHDEFMNKTELKVYLA